MKGSHCRSCQAPIVWGLTTNGKPCPYDLDAEGNPTAIPHFATCPDAEQWGSARRPETALATVPDAPPGTLVRPIASGEDAREAFDQFQELKRTLLTEHDVQEGAGRTFIKRSGFLKLAAAFGVSIQILSTERDVLLAEDGRAYHLWRCVARAVAPNGRIAEAVGACASNERRFAHKDADPYATAQTRATNRAVANLIGGGEVSAEELEPPAMTIIEATALVNTFMEHLTEREWPEGAPPNQYTIMAALVLTKGDLRLAWRWLTTGRTERLVPSE